MSRAGPFGSRKASRTPELLVPALLGGLILVYFALPFVAFLSRAGAATVVSGLSSPAAQEAIRNSVVTAPISTAIATAFGVPLAYVLARRSFPGKRLVEVLVILPLVVPPRRRRRDAVDCHRPIHADRRNGGRARNLADRQLGRRRPRTDVRRRTVITARAGFGAVDERVEQASRSLGHGPLETFWNVSLPLARGAILAGVILTFARAIGEFGATMMVAYNPRTMPTRIWVEFIAGGIDATVPLALALLAITLVVVAVVQRVGRVPTVIDR
jgi:molybdate/tungstate transport system permease protein